MESVDFAEADLSSSSSSSSSPPSLPPSVGALAGQGRNS